MNKRLYLLILLTLFVLTACSTASGMPREAELVLIREVGSDFYLWDEPEEYADGTYYCVHTVDPGGLVRTYEVEQQNGIWAVVEGERRGRCADYNSGVFGSFSSDPFAGKPHVRP